MKVLRASVINDLTRKYGMCELEARWVAHEAVPLVDALPGILDTVLDSASAGADGGPA